MDRILFCLLSLTLIAMEITSATIIYSPDGDVINCTNILAQSAFEHPLLKHHKIQEIPVTLPNVANTNIKVRHWQRWHHSSMRCPEGTIPVRNMSRQDTNYKPQADITKGHEHALGFLDTKPHFYYGSKFTMSVEHPNIDIDSDEFSLGQIWLTSGSYDNDDLHTLEAGWQVFPGKYYDSQPRLFIYWTNDAYKVGGCYNLRCPGFIQTSRDVLLEGAIALLSTRTELTVQIWKDPVLGHWWLSIGPDNTTGLIPVGYWPVEVFANFTYAADVKWGGEITHVNDNDLPEMGSGYPPNSTKAAYMRDIEILVDKKRDFQPVKKLKIFETYPKYYRAKVSGKTSFSYGGPSEGVAAHFRVDLIVIYFCFGLVLLI